MIKSYHSIMPSVPLCTVTENLFSNDIPCQLKNFYKISKCSVLAVFSVVTRDIRKLDSEPDIY